MMSPSPNLTKNKQLDFAMNFESQFAGLHNSPPVSVPFNVERSNLTPSPNHRVVYEDPKQRKLREREIRIQ